MAIKADGSAYNRLIINNTFLSPPQYTHGAITYRCGDRWGFALKKVFDKSFLVPESTLMVALSLQTAQRAGSNFSP